MTTLVSTENVIYIFAKTVQYSAPIIDMCHKLKPADRPLEIQRPMVIGTSNAAR